MDRQPAVRRWLLVVAMLAGTSGLAPAQVRFGDAADREAFRDWFVFLADAQFYRPTADVIDCAALVRHAAREAIRPHTADWHRQARLPITPALPTIRVRPSPTPEGWPLFRTGPHRWAEFADARTIVGLNTRPLGRDTAALRPADLLYFRQDEQDFPDHLMVYVGPSRFEAGNHDWIVYHTGPTADGPGEVRKTRLVDLQQHPAQRWRPMPANKAFVGVFRLAWL